MQKSTTAWTAAGAKHGTTGIANFDVTGTIIPSHVATADTYFDLRCRDNGSGDYYDFRWVIGASWAQIVRNVAGVWNAEVAGTGHTVTGTVGVGKKFRFRAVGSLLSYKWWDAGSSEPGPWMFQGTDTTFTGTLPIEIAYMDSTTIANYLDVDDLTLDTLTDLETLRPDAILENTETAETPAGRSNASLLTDLIRDVP